MRILFQSYAFYPSCGGIESSALLLIREFQKAGADVKVQTLTPLGDNKELTNVAVSRLPCILDLIREAKWADLVYQHNPSLRLGVPLSFLSVPKAVSIRTWISRADGTLSLADHLKRFWISRQTIISNSKATADHLKNTSTVIENAYDDQIFINNNRIDRSGMAFVGRLVSDKGCDTAIEAVHFLAKNGIDLSLDIIGNGPEQKKLQRLAEKLEVKGAIRFLGRKQAYEVAELLNQKKYLLVPSRWSEPFGIVALEGIACGCVPIGSRRGGLVDAIGKCGPLVATGAAMEIAASVECMEKDLSVYSAFVREHNKHLQMHSPQIVATRYLEVFNSICV